MDNAVFFFFSYFICCLKKYFIYIGRQDTYKNLSRLIQAFSQICHVTDTQLWIVGPHDKRYTPQLGSQAQALGIQERIRFLSYVSYSELPK